MNIVDSCIVHLRPALLAVVLCLSGLAVPVASAEGLLAGTHLLDIRQGSARSDTVRGASRGGYELTAGRRIDLRDWYSSRWTDLEIDFLTEIDRDFGIIWGLSTGERGEKYRITPGLKLGFIYSTRPTERTTLTLTATTRLGSVLSERPCTADYGAIGGVQQVNCRLAASTLPPAETRKHDFDLSGRSDTEMALQYEMRF